MNPYVIIFVIIIAVWAGIKWRVVSKKNLAALFSGNATEVIDSLIKIIVIPAIILDLCLYANWEQLFTLSFMKMFLPFLICLGVLEFYFLLRIWFRTKRFYHQLWHLRCGHFSGMAYGSWRYYNAWIHQKYPQLGEKSFKDEVKYAHWPKTWRIIILLTGIGHGILARASYLYAPELYEYSLWALGWYISLLCLSLIFTPLGNPTSDSAVKKILEN